MKNFLKKLKTYARIGFWVAMVLIGMVLVCYGIAQVIALDELMISDIIKISITFVAGFVIFVLGIIFMQKRILDAKVYKDEDEETAGDIKDKGPKIVVIGGGIGLTRVLTGLKNYTNNLTAIVTVSTYGNEEKRTPTDDIKNSLVALAKNEKEMQDLLECNMGNSKFGDIYLSVMGKSNKDLATGVEKSNSILAITGKVLPVTLDEMKICVELDDGTVIEEKEKIAEITSNKATQINRVYINPTNCRVAPGVIEAIKDADAIVMGPGELYTGVIPNLLIRNVAKTIRESNAFKIYVSNIMTEPGHTDDYTVSDHLNAIAEHAGKNIINYCICDYGDIIPEILRKYIKAGSNLVELDKQNIKGVKVIRADVSCVEGEYIRHDSDLTARNIIDVIVSEVKYKDKPKDEQFVFLNEKLKETNKKARARKKESIQRRRLPKTGLKSKFSTKYKERILSIQESGDVAARNKRKQERLANQSDMEAEEIEVKLAPKREPKREEKHEEKKEEKRKEERREVSKKTQPSEGKRSMRRMAPEKPGRHSNSRGKRAKGGRRMKK